ncbi:MAG: hypothetical protein ING90_11180 [Rhodocyclaceae bacterium]|nr:hypothetical protein [Rhodocyclaceae bacterium]MCA3088374.1 hypothetical protein [Rhodocyclaceae bacterium]MCA3096112.1 hypothetical protein [Rhodocyclaceae bacterium]MCA3096618.1 hypothetical protein [Rhodocyclaceae bacterium]MCA3123204.1 hypothetical protein [Rhodocyclaceae bacterium]
MSLQPNLDCGLLKSAWRTFILQFGWLCAATMIAGAALATVPVPPALPAPVAAPATDPRTVPLDFSYRVNGTGPAIGIVFDDGRDVFVQPVNRIPVSSLRVIDLPFRVQGPYLVVRGLSNRIEVDGAGAAGAAGDRTIIEYTGQRRVDVTDSNGHCISLAPEERRVTVPFGTGVLQTEPGGLDHLARMMAIARGARRITIIAQGDRSNSPIALRRAAHLRALLVAAGVEPGVIVEQVQAPAASSAHVIALRDGAPCAQPTVASTAALPARAAVPAPESASAAPDPLPVSGPKPPKAAGDDADLAGSAAPELRLIFRPDSSVQATLRDYLKAHGMDVEFRAMPVLMVEVLAEVGGSDVRDVLRRALSRLGLRGEIQGNRLLVVELAR